jgi:RNA recognition motif-containing protein
MNNRLHVGNLPANATERELRESFTQVGKVESVKIMTGYAFVEMSSEAEAAQVLAAFNGALLGGKPLEIAFARPKGSR